MPARSRSSRALRKLRRGSERLRWKWRASRAPGWDPGSAAADVALPPLVVVVVIDGLRPDSIDPADTPNLHRLRSEGVSFSGAHSVFPTATRVNAAAIATGAYPASNGIMHNTVYLPQVDAGASMTTGRADLLLAAQHTLGSALVSATSLGEILAEHGMTLVAVSSASSGSALLLNPRAPEGVGVLVNGGLEPGVRVAYPDHVNDEIVRRFGPAPEKAGPKRQRDALVDWTQRVLLEYALPHLAPDVVIDWFTEPDHVQHHYGAGSPQAREALRGVDRRIGELVETIERLGHTARTSLFVLSDHGVTRQSTSVDIEAALIDAGLKDGPGSADVVVAAGGPTVQLHVAGHDSDRIRAIVAFLQAQEWTGVLFTPADPPPGTSMGAGGRPGDTLAGGQGWVPGTFSLDLVHLRHPERSCDVLLTLGWTSEPNEHGVRGTETAAAATGGRVANTGHGGLSPWAIRTVFFGRGAGLRDRTAVATPVGQVDLVPTILRLKGIDRDGLDGRVLTEALGGSGPGPEGGDRPESPTAKTDVLTTVSPDGLYRAELRISTVGDHRYLDEGSRQSPRTRS